MRSFSILSVLAVGVLAGACVAPRGTQVVVVGESGASGAEAAREANNFIANAEASGCDAVSVGGYAAGARSEGGGLLIGIPVLLDCPPGTRLLPDGTRAP
jgi:hypothetical protein